tara:strand:+ start:12375 stop:13397 length:1023 start_codon:yes stop_codon:yes gene_type:complete
MKRILCLFIIITICIIGCDSEEKELIDASSIINKAIEASGGKSALRSIKTRKEEGVSLIFIYDSLFRTKQFTTLKKTGGKYYYQSPTYQKKYGEKLVFATNGEYSWTQNDGAFAPYMQPKEEHTNRNGEDYPYLFGLDESGVKTVFKGEVEENNEKLLRVDYIDKDGKVEEVYFEKVSGLIRKTRAHIETSQGRAERIRYFNDYREVEGIMIPFSYESHFPPREVDAYLIRSIEVNKEIPDASFEFPKSKELNKNEIGGLIGSYFSEGKTMKIFEKKSKLLIKYPNKPEKELLIVDQNLLMYRDGNGDGSRVANIQPSQMEGKAYVDITLRKVTERWVKK